MVDDTIGSGNSQHLSELGFIWDILMESINRQFKIR